MIETERQYDETLEKIEYLMKIADSREFTPGESIEFERLCVDVEAYEDMMFPIPEQQ